MQPLVTSLGVNGASKTDFCVANTRVEAGTLLPHMQPGLLLLCRSYQFAAAQETDVWDYAVELDELRRAGLSNNDLRWLISHGWVRHALEVAETNQRRAFRPLGKGAMPRNAAFTLTLEGARVVVPLFHSEFAGVLTAENRVNPDSEQANRDSLPLWDAQHRELRYRETVIKRFRVPAPIQEIILVTFQEENWPPFVDDPLPPTHQDTKERLHAAINCLNRSRLQRTLRFRGDGTGTRVGWQLC